MGQIARHAGLSRQALYLHFADRASLFVEVSRMADAAARTPERQRRVDEAPTARDALRAGAEHVFRDRTRSAKRLAQRISSTPATRQGHQERPDLYARLVHVARAILRQAEQVQQRLGSSTDRTAARIRASLRQ